MEIISSGDSAMIVRVSDNFAADPEAALAAVLEARDRLCAAAIPGVIDIAPAYDSVGVFYDPARGLSGEALCVAIREALERRAAKGKSPRRVVEIPVCYEGDFAPDLSEIAHAAELSEKEIVRRHAAAKYRVACVGFAPGFPYLSGLPVELATPRRATPRIAVPAGSVAIGGGQTGIYPHASPGGWNVIGRTPRRLFDAARAEPALLRAGDCVRFRAISLEEFEHLSDETTR